LPLGGPRPRAVLAVLALDAPRPCSAEHLIDHLYGDNPPPTARNAIQVNVTGLRKTHAASGVRIDRIGDGYALAGPAVVDVAEFDAKVSDGRNALRAGDPERAVTSLHEALRMWGGQPLDGVGTAPFADTSR